MTTRFQWTGLILLVGLLGGAWIIISREPIAKNDSLDGLTEGVQAGYLAPDFTLQTVSGESITLSELRGQPVLLNFWATWCPPCRQEMPHLESTHANFAGKAVILGVDQGEPATLISDFAEEFGVSFPLLVDEDSRVNQLYGVRGLPTTIFIDENGVVAELFAGILNEAIATDKLNELVVDN